MSDHEKDIDNTEAAWPPSDDESTPFRGKPVLVHSRYPIVVRFIAVTVVLSYVIFGGLYLKLKLHSMDLESQIRGLQPELFPSLAKSTSFRQDSRVFPLTVAGTPFAGVPSSELDHAWHELLEGTVIRVAREDLDYYNVTSLPLADGSGYASEIFMTHELHCLKKIRQWMYKESYFEDVQGLARNELERHISKS
ncbi:hypothetical protein J4E83_004125 [Alternaria metachromatica]|uniref:uncharacterized protein n=1 Tax=Alternaria metachromatica TaxID=283354 RepID=UPI0020C39117|nr:uncharacterized protein J4E83_004125 [Alternaria metachromatica]KAI4624451.1 hypothetical protein J4E83_004125 [Alternaria metachromatica]